MFDSFFEPIVLLVAGGAESECDGLSGAAVDIAGNGTGWFTGSGHGLHNQVIRTSKPPVARKHRQAKLNRRTAATMTPMTPHKNHIHTFDITFLLSI